MKEKIEFAIRENARKLRELSGLKGGNERWLQGQIILFFIDGHGYVAPTSIQQEIPFTGGGILDIGLSSSSANPFKTWNIIELKILSANTRLGDVSADLTRVWSTPLPQVNAWWSANLKDGRGYAVIVNDTRLYQSNDVIQQLAQELKAKYQINIGDTKAKAYKRSLDSTGFDLILFENRY